MANDNSDVPSLYRDASRIHDLSETSIGELLNSQEITEALHAELKKQSAGIAKKVMDELDKRIEATIITATSEYRVQVLSKRAEMKRKLEKATNEAEVETYKLIHDMNEGLDRQKSIAVEKDIEASKDRNYKRGLRMISDSIDDLDQIAAGLKADFDRFVKVHLDKEGTKI